MVRLVLPASVVSRLLIAAIVGSVVACGPSATDRPASPATTVQSAQPAATTPSTSVASSPATPSAPASGEAAAPFRSDAWTRLADAPVALTEVAAAAHQGRVWIAGGLKVDGDADDRVFTFDPGTAAWTEGPRLPEPIHHASLVSTGGDLYLLGGYRGAISGGSVSAAVRRLDAASARWVDGPALPAARGAGAAAWDGSRIVFAGGVSPAGVAREVWALEGPSWQLLGPLSRAREHLAATSDGQGRTWLLGGRAQSLQANVGTIEVVEGDQVRSAGATMTPRSGVAAFWSQATGACLAGGEGPNGTHAQVECVSIDGRVAALPSLGVSRHGLGAAVIGGVAYVVLGGEQPGLFVSPVVEALALAAR
jgi:hypothetical protein